jgi:hypothetical protein
MGKLQLRVQHIAGRSKLLLVDLPLPHEAEELQLLYTAVALMMMKTYSFAKPLAIDLAPHNLVHENNNMGIRPKYKSLLEHPKSTHIPHTHCLSLSTTTGASQRDKFQIERSHREDSHGSNCPKTVQNPGTLKAFKLRGKQAGLTTLKHSETTPDLNWGRLDLGSEDRLPIFSGRFCPLDRLIWFRDAQDMTTKM